MRYIKTFESFESPQITSLEGSDEVDWDAFKSGKSQPSDYKERVSKRFN